MKKMIHSIFLILLLLFTGCNHLNQNEALSDKQFMLLEKEVENLDVEQKKKIYTLLQKDVQKYKNKADKEYRLAHYANAIEAYEMVNFYEEKNTVSLKKIKKIAKKNAAYHYNQAQKYKKTNKKKFLKELNKVMINNPNYKNSQELIRVTKSQMQKFLYTKENKLSKELMTNKGSVQELIILSRLADDLRQYEYDNQNIIKADRILKAHYQPLINKAVREYKNSNITQSKKDFQSIAKIYKNDRSVKKYLKQIKILQNKQVNMDLANQAFHNTSYDKSVIYAKRVLSVDKKNDEALQLIEQAKKKISRHIKVLIAQGKKAYKNKNLKQAQSKFKQVLKIDPDNTESLVYYNKIKGQLRTINNLK